MTPLQLSLPADRLATSLTLGNRGDSPVTVQAELLAWSQDRGEDAYAPASGLIVSPPIFTLAPGARQVVRIGRPRRGAAPAREQAFRIRLAEVPPRTDTAPAVTTLMQLSLPIFVPPAERGARPALAVTATPAGNGLRLAVANTGAVRDKLTRLVLRQDGRTVAERALNYYVLAGARRELAWPGVLAQARPGKLELTVQLAGHERSLAQTLELKQTLEPNMPPPAAEPAQKP